MNISTMEYPNCDVISASGRVDSFTAPRLAEAFQTMIDRGHCKLVFDMSTIDYISSAGLRVMIDVQKNCRLSNNGELKLVSVPKRVSETLELAGFIPLFKIYSDLDIAIADF
jgi:anti-sigma B factor antagonist